MSEPSKAAISKACELLNDFPGKPFMPEKDGNKSPVIAFALYIDKVNYQRNVLLAMAHKGVIRSMEAEDCLAEFALEEPVDPLRDILSGCGIFREGTDQQEVGRLFRAELERRGGKIVWEAE